tara:strand:+ start:232 stop:687 length:456 start_codon:yes stop_codon:yes gene_type:complete
MNEETNRAPHEQDSRENKSRESDSWKPASSLPQPNRRDGVSHRWIRTAMLGQADNTNVSQKMREGWIPVKASEYPEIDFVPEVGSRYPENIEYGGLLLCAIASEQLDKRNEYYSKMAVNQMEAVNNSFLSEQDPRMAKFQDNSSRTTFGRK